MSVSTIDCAAYRSDLLGLAADLPRVPRAQLQAFFDKGIELGRRLPEPLRTQVSDFNANGNRDGYLLLRNLPVEDEEALPATPSSGAAPADRELLNMEAMLCIFGGALGLLTAYDQGYGNRRSIDVLHELFPVPNPHPLSGATSKTQLDFHTDLSHHARQPNYILLSASRGDHEGKAATLVSSIRKALPLLTPEVRDHLFDREFVRHFDSEHPEELSKVKPLYGDREDPYVSYNLSLMNTETEEDNIAMAALADALQQVTEAVVLRRGDLLVIDNFRVTHGRAPFTARWDGTDRWLHRSYVRTDRNGQLVGGERSGEVVPFLARG